MDLSLLAGILVVANVLAFRYGGRPLDLTREGAYSLTPETVTQVQALDRPVTFTLISGRGPVAELQKVRVRQLLESYRSINPRLIRVRDLNPYEDMAGGEELIKRAPELALLRGGGILIEYGEDKETPPVVVRIQELFELPSPGQLRSGDRFHAPFTGEDAITSALLRFREGKGGKVAFTTGHGELRIDDPGLRGLLAWKSRLARVGCQVVDLNLGEGDVPDDIELLIVAGPVDPFKPQEAARIKTYADRGGPVLLLLGNDRPSGLEEFLKAHNLEIGKGMILDPRTNYNGDWKYVLATARSGVEHPISAAMAADRMVLLPQSAPIHVAGMSARPGAPPADPVDKNLVPSPILRTSRTAWVGDRPTEPAGYPGRLRRRRARSGDRRRGRRAAQGAGPAGRRAGGAAEAGPLRLPLDGREHVPGHHAGQPRPAHEFGELAPRPPRYPGDLAPDAHRLDAQRRPATRVAADPGPIGHGRHVDHRHGDHCLRRAARMMKSNLTRFVLFVLFFAALLSLWVLDVAGVRTTSEKERDAGRVVPELIDTPESTIRRVAIDRGEEHLVFERRGKGPGRWQMVQPRDVAAEPNRLEALVRNLRELRPVPESGTVRGEPSTYGLAPPAATVRLYTVDGTAGGSASADRPVAELELGKAEAKRGLRYVRATTGEGIQVVDSRLLAAVNLPAAEWREPNLMGVPSFQVASVKITRQDESGREPRVIRAVRGRSNRWRLTEPIEAPGNGPKIESLLGALASLRVAEPPRGFVADDVKDAARFGLDRPPIKVELTTTEPGAHKVVLEIGKAIPDEPERVYARQGEQDDVVAIESRALSEVPGDATALRSQEVAEIVPAAVDRIEIQTIRDVHKLTKERGGWQIISPRTERADGQAVNAFIARIADLQTYEFLEPSKVPNPLLDPPVMRIKVWQAAARRPGASAAEADPPPVLNLRLGRQDVARKTVFARLEGDNMILALPDNLLDVVPKNPMAFRDRSIITDSPPEIKKLTIHRGDRVDELVPDRTGKPNTWRMLRPVEAPADAGTITQVLTALCSLRSEDFAASEVGDGKEFGLDHPSMRIDWESQGPHWLKIGRQIPRSSHFFAATDGQPTVFTLSSQTVRLLDGEYHDHRVMSFPMGRARRLVLRFQGAPSPCIIGRRRREGRSNGCRRPAPTSRASTSRG